MKKTLLLVSILLLMISSISWGQKKDFGFGLLVEAPTGFTGKYWLPTSDAALQGFIGGGFGGVTVGGDYLFYSDAFDHPDFSFYVGPGLFIGASAVGGPHYESKTLGRDSMKFYGELA